MKILFFSYCYYIQYEPIIFIIRNFLEGDIKVYLLYISNINLKDESKSSSHRKFIKDSIPFIEIKLPQFNFYKIKIIQSFLQLFQFLLNRRTVKKFLNLYNLEYNGDTEKNLEAILNHIVRFECLE